MVPTSGTTSNADTQLLSEWNKQNKALLDDASIEEIFETLAQWNEYLEKHVPDFKEPQI